jgi:hypothetical protein
MLTKTPAAKAQQLGRKRSVVRKTSAGLPPSNRPISKLKIESRFLRIAPDGDGYMPLSAALHWIASKWLTCAPDTCLNAKEQYQAAAAEFKTPGSSGKVRVIGADHNRTVEPFPPDQFATVRWCFVFNESDLFFGDHSSRGPDRDHALWGRRTKRRSVLGRGQSTSLDHAASFKRGRSSGMALPEVL